LSEEHEVDVDREIEELRESFSSIGKETLILEVLSILSDVRKGYDTIISGSYPPDPAEVEIKQRKYKGHLELVDKLMDVYTKI
jgi:hypothetical protein